MNADVKPGCCGQERRGGKKKKMGLAVQLHPCRERNGFVGSSRWRLLAAVPRFSSRVCPSSPIPAVIVTEHPLVCPVHSRFLLSSLPPKLTS